MKELLDKAASILSLMNAYKEQLQREYDCYISYYDYNEPSVTIDGITICETDIITSSYEIVENLSELQNS